MSHIHDCPINPQTISGGLGLTDAYFNELGQEVHSTFKAEETISDALLSICNQIRRDELDSPDNLSRYERKILLAGYLVGVIATEVRHTQEKNEGLDRSLQELKSLLKKLGESDLSQD